MLPEEFYDDRGESVPFFGSLQGSFFKLCKREGVWGTHLISRRHAIHNIAKYLSRIY